MECWYQQRGAVHYLFTTVATEEKTRSSSPEKYAKTCKKDFKNGFTMKTPLGATISSS
jgi:hypothetical protein